MSDDEHWEIPRKLQPDPNDYGFDIEAALRAVVGLRAGVPADAFTADTLGTERAGSGVVIREDGLVATIGYLITEAETIWLTTADGRAVPGHALAYDQESGFGLVQPLGRLDLPHLQMGDAERLAVDEGVVFAAAGGRRHAIATRVVARQEFAGYWEYVLDRAIFTAPAHPLWGGAAVIGEDGRLLGIGSLILQQGDGEGRRLDMNMAVPISLLAPILGDLLSLGPGEPAAAAVARPLCDGERRGAGGRRAGRWRPGRPVPASAPATASWRWAGEDVTDLAGLWRQVWAAGPAGSEVRLRLARDGEMVAVAVTSGDRTRFLRAPRLH